MATNVQTDQPTIGELASGIIDDAQRLIREEMRLVRQDVKEDLKRFADTGVNLGIASVVGGLAAVMLCFMLVHLINYLSNNAVPLWGCYAIVGGVLAVVALVLFYRGAEQASDLNLVPERAIAALEEPTHGPRQQS